MKAEARDIGFGVKAPKNKCEDARCPFHGSEGIKLRGRIFTGTIVSDRMHSSAIVEWGRHLFVPKYERHKKRKTKVNAHNPPCINAREGDRVKIMECRPLSKSKSFIIIENLGKVKGYEEMKEALEESKVKDKKKEEKEAKEAAQTGEQGQEIKEQAAKAEQNPEPGQRAEGESD